MEGMNPGSFLLNAVFFWWVVSPFEASFGRPHTIRLLAMLTIGAALPVLVFGLIFGDGGGAEAATAGPLILGPLLSVHVHIIGAIAAYAWAMRFRGKMSFFGILELSTNQLLLLLAGMSLLYFLASKNASDLIADLAAIGCGVGFIEWLSKPKKPEKKKKKANPAGLYVVPDDDDGKKWLN